MISKKIVKEIKDRIDIIEIVRDNVKNLKKTGKNWTGLCPFHNDKSPSFSISEDYGFYKCFACGESGDVIKFVQKIENIDFNEAVKILAKKAGIELEYKNGNDTTLKLKDELLSFNERLVKLFQYFLLDLQEGSVPLQYLSDRKIDRNIIEVFKIGYSPRGYRKLESIIKNKGFKDDFLLQTGAFSKSEDGSLKTLFFDRVMFPIYNYRNECVGFGGRVLNDEIKPKYLNSPETMLYKKSFNLYGLNWAKDSIQKTGKVYVVEGYVDVISCYKNGLKNVVAPCGTALTKEQVKLLSRYANDVVLLLDGDEAGLKGIVKALKETANIENIKTGALILPDNMDPDDFFKKYNLDDFYDFEKSSRDGFEFIVDYNLRTYDKKDYRSLVKLLSNVFEYITLWDKDIIKNNFISTLAQKLELDNGIIFREYENYRKNLKVRFESENKSTDENNIEKNILTDLYKKELDLLLILSLFDDSKELIYKSSFKSAYFFYEENKVFFENIFVNESISKKNILDFIASEPIRKYANNRIFTDELKLDQSVLWNNAVDRISELIYKHYTRISDELSEKIKYGVLYKDEEIVKELLEEKTIIANEKLKIVKLQELKK